VGAGKTKRRGKDDKGDYVVGPKKVMPTLFTKILKLLEH
jgi:hypothetical protein